MAHKAFKLAKALLDNPTGIDLAEELAEKNLDAAMAAKDKDAVRVLSEILNLIEDAKEE